jgi:chromate transporter
MIYLLLFWEFFKIGLFTFGGAYAMIPLIKEAVFAHQWLTESQFYDFIGVCESTPGPIAINMATYVGATQAGFLGSLVATLGVVLPSFVIILLVATVLAKLTSNKWFKRILEGIKPVIIGLILSTGMILLAKVFGYETRDSFAFNPASAICFGSLCLVSLAYRLIRKKSVPAIALIVVSAGLGIGVCWLCNLYL